MYSLTILSDLADVTGVSASSPYAIIGAVMIALFLVFSFFSFVFSFFSSLFNV